MTGKILVVVNSWQLLSCQVIKNFHVIKNYFNFWHYIFPVGYNWAIWTISKIYEENSSAFGEADLITSERDASTFLVRAYDN